MNSGNGNKTAGAQAPIPHMTAAPSAPGAFSDAQLAQIKAMMSESFAQGAASVPRLPDDEVKAQRRIADQHKAGQAEHPIQYGSLRHKQTLRDGTLILGRETFKDGEQVFLETAVEYRAEPDGKRIVGGKYDGKFL